MRLQRCIISLVTVVAVFMVLSTMEGPVYAAGCDGSNIIFSEIDYDQPGTDNAEFIELRIVAAATISNCELRLLNGNTPSAPVQYRAIDLSGTYAAGKYLLIASTGVAGGGDITIGGTCSTNCIQNGPSDAFALVDTSGPSSLVWLISYGGQITNYDPGDGTLNSSTDLPVAEDGDAPNRSLINGPTEGLGDVTTTQTPTPGAANENDGGTPTAITLRGLSARSTGAGLPVAGLALVGLLVGVVVVRRK